MNEVIGDACAGATTAARDGAALVPLRGFELLHALGPEPNVRRARNDGSLGDGSLDDGRPAGPVLGSCPDSARRALTASMTLIVEVLAGRRHRDALGAAQIDARVLAGLRHRLRAGGLRGAALRTLHPSGRPCGTRVEFVGSCAYDGRVRALAGAMIDGPKGWTITALRFI
ncbi:Rv3235 family protein [uncultured Corynebacterium sp.]|uniref:Rv3235 family protein n=1 Tax=uncultured Corynebacterium sp. TaxID=159447 RepID=UPI0025D8A18B|nr:Rv3235 family protein [uncultured Corynebacterium sp.]